MGRMAGDHALDALHIETRGDALTHEQAINELVRGSGTQFDPDVVRAFTRLSVAG